MLDARYKLMKKSDYKKGSDGTYYPDPLTFSEKKFKFLEYPFRDYELTSNDIERFDILIFNLYGNTKYCDLILTMNDVRYIWELNPGDTISFPTKNDLDRYIKEGVE